MTQVNRLDLLQRHREYHRTKVKEPRQGGASTGRGNLKHMGYTSESTANRAKEMAKVDMKAKEPARCSKCRPNQDGIFVPPAVPLALAAGLMFRLLLRGRLQDIQEGRSRARFSAS